MILVVGATGQLGSLVVRELRKSDTPVRAMVREPRAAADLAATGAELVTADLKRPESLDAAVQGVTAVIATANVVAPTRPGDTHAAVEERGYAELIARAASAGVRRFVFASVPVTPLDDEVPQIRAKRRIEALLAAAPFSCLAVRFSLFTEVWLALVGSSLPMRGERPATLERPYGFLRQYRRLTGRSIEDHGLMLLPGPAWHRHAFLSVHDAARVLVAALGAEDLRGAVQVGGPQVLSWADVARLYGHVLGRTVRILSLPGPLFRVLQRLLTGVAPAAANLLGMNRLVGAVDTDWQTAELTDRLGVHGLRTVEQVLREKADLPPTRRTRSNPVQHRTLQA